MRRIGERACKHRDEARVIALGPRGDGLSYTRTIVEGDAVDPEGRGHAVAREHDAGDVFELLVDGRATEAVQVRPARAPIASDHGGRTDAAMYGDRDVSHEEQTTAPGGEVDDGRRDDGLRAAGGTLRLQCGPQEIGHGRRERERVDLLLSGCAKLFEQRVAAGLLKRRFAFEGQRIEQAAADHARGDVTHERLAHPVGDDCDARGAECAKAAPVLSRVVARVELGVPSVARIDGGRVGAWEPLRDVLHLPRSLSRDELDGGVHRAIAWRFTVRGSAWG